MLRTVIAITFTLFAANATAARLTPFVVTSLKDSGKGTLRDAVSKGDVTSLSRLVG